MRNNVFYQPAMPIQKAPPSHYSSVMDRDDYFYDSENIDYIDYLLEDPKPIKKKKLKTNSIHDFQEDVGIYIATGSDGSQWYIVPMHAKKKGEKYEINRMTPTGTIVVEEKQYNSREQAKKIIYAKISASIS